MGQSRSGHRGLMCEEGEGSPGRALPAKPRAASPVIRAGYQRPSCCLARHAEPACRELRSGSWKGRSSSMETTCPWENLQRGPQGRGSDTAQQGQENPGEPSLPAWALPCREGDRDRHTHTCVQTHTRMHTCTPTHTPAYTRPPACTQVCTHNRTHTHAHPHAHSHTCMHTHTHRNHQLNLSAEICSDIRNLKIWYTP